MPKRPFIETDDDAGSAGSEVEGEDDDEQSGEDDKRKDEEYEEYEEYEDAEDGEDGDAAQEDEDEAPSADESGDSVQGDAESPSAKPSTVANKMQKRLSTIQSQKEKIAKLEELLETWMQMVRQKEEELATLRRIDGSKQREIDQLRQQYGITASSVPTNEDASTDPKARPQIAPVRSLMASASNPADFAIGIVLPSNTESAALPYSYKGTAFRFPHRLQRSKSGVRQLVVESRNNVHLACQLRNVALSRNATELELPIKGDLFFKLEVCLADSGAVLTTADLKQPLPHLLEPPEGTIARMKMVKGVINWRFKCKFLSRMTMPYPNQEFVLRIRCLNPELASFSLEAETPRFLVVSREVKPM